MEVHHHIRKTKTLNRNTYLTPGETIIPRDTFISLFTIQLDQDFNILRFDRLHHISKVVNTIPKVLLFNRFAIQLFHSAHRYFISYISNVIYYYNRKKNRRKMKIGTASLLVFSAALSSAKGFAPSSVTGRSQLRSTTR